MVYCSAAVLGALMPFLLNTYWVKPEQSKPLGVTPPQTYGTPIKLFAVLITELAFELDAADVPLLVFELLVGVLDFVVFTDATTFFTVLVVVFLVLVVALLAVDLLALVVAVDLLVDVDFLVVGSPLDERDIVLAAKTTAFSSS